MRHILKNILEHNEKEYDINHIYDYYKNDGSILEINKEIQDKIYESLGMLLAEDDNYGLQIKELSAYVQYKVYHDFEGLEFIIYY